MSAPHNAPYCAECEATHDELARLRAENQRLTAAALSLAEKCGDLETKLHMSDLAVGIGQAAYEEEFARARAAESALPALRERLEMIASAQPHRRTDIHGIRSGESWEEFATRLQGMAVVIDSPAAIRAIPIEVKT